MKKASFIILPVVLVALLGSFLIFNNSKNHNKNNLDTRTESKYVNNELPQTFQVKNNKVLYSYLDGFIGEKTDYNMNNGGIIYLFNKNYSSVYGSVYPPVEMGQGTTWLPPIGSQPKAMYNSKNLQNLVSSVQKKYPNAVVKDGNYELILVDYNNSDLINYMNSLGMTIQQDMQGKQNNSSFYKLVNDDGQGWPTDILRKPIYADQLKNYNNIDMNRDFWNSYNMSQTSVYKDSQGAKYRVIAGPNPDQFTYTNGDFSYSFQNTGSKKAIDQLHDWIKENKMQLLTGRAF